MKQNDWECQTIGKVRNNAIADFGIELLDGIEIGDRVSWRFESDTDLCVGNAEVDFVETACNSLAQLSLSRGVDHHGSPGTLSKSPGSRCGRRFRRFAPMYA